MKNYQEQATKFCKKYGIKVSTRFIKNDLYFTDDNEPRDIFLVNIRRISKTPLAPQFSISFGQSIANQGQEPTPYDVLACITKYEPGTFEQFCSEFGYDTDSRTAERTYKNVVKEWAKVKAFFTPGEIEALTEIN